MQAQNGDLLIKLKRSGPDLFNSISRTQIHAQLQGRIQNNPRYDAAPKSGTANQIEEIRPQSLPFDEQSPDTSTAPRKDTSTAPDTHADPKWGSANQIEEIWPQSLQCD